MSVAEGAIFTSCSWGDTWSEVKPSGDEYAICISRQAFLTPVTTEHNDASVPQNRPFEVNNVYL